MDAVSLQTFERSTLGKKVKALRREGLTPLHVYGPGGPPVSLQAPSAQVARVVKTAGRTTPVSVTVDGDSNESLTFIRDVAVHPATGEIQHVDFLRIQTDRKVEVPVEVVLVGDAPATVGGQAQINQLMRTLTVLAFPLNVPSRIEGDLSRLVEVGDVLRVSDLSLPADVEPAGSPEDVVARAQRQREAEVFEGVGEEALEGAEAAAVEDGGEAPEGEDGAEAAASESADDDE